MEKNGTITETLSLFTIYGLIVGVIAVFAIAHYQITKNAEAIEYIKTTTGLDHDRLERIDQKTEIIERDVRFIRSHILKDNR